MKQLFSGSSDQDVIDFVKSKLENNCDRYNANIAIERLVEWKERPDKVEESENIRYLREQVGNLEDEVEVLENQIGDAVSILESEDESLEHKITAALGELE